MEKNKSGERKEIKEESKKKADYTAKVTQNRSTEKQGSQLGKKRSTKSRTNQKENKTTRRIEDKQSK